ncbi:MAG: hypothetical protein MHM6MM_004207 [Cercozoa sp. M6MM]
MLATVLRRAAVQRRHTTILCVRKGDEVVMMGDGQVSTGNTVAKNNGRKIRTISNGKGGVVMTGIAGAVADAFRLRELIEKELKNHPGQLLRASVAVATLWKTDKMLRNLQAQVIVADEEVSLSVSGSGEVFEPEDDILAVGSGGEYARAAAKALCTVDGLSAREVATRAMKVAGDLDIYSNHNTLTDSLPNKKSAFFGEDYEEDSEASEDTDSQDQQSQQQQLQRPHEEQSHEQQEEQSHEQSADSADSDTDDNEETKVE